MAVPNNQAPELKFTGHKWNSENEQRLSIADRLWVKLGNKKLTANERLFLLVLLGQKEGFHPSEKFITERTGFSHDTYITTRKKLSDKGFITILPYESITIHIDKIDE